MWPLDHFKFYHKYMVNDVQWISLILRGFFGNSNNKFKKKLFLLSS